MGHSFPSPESACASGSLDRPGRNSHRRASREGAFILEREESPGPFAPGGAPSQTRPRGASRASRSGFYRKTLRPDFVSGEFRVEHRGLRPRCATRSKIVTWLILPVVICLSQRLSHACLSITFILGNCEWLIKSVIVYLMVLYSDNRRNSRANTCANPDFWKGRIY